MEFQPGLAHVASPREREWLVPSTLLTALLGISAVALMPAAGYSSPPPYFSRFINWMVWCLIGAMLLFIIYVVRLMIAGVERPTSHMKQQFQAKWGLILAAAFGVVLAQVDMLFFMWIKPEINAVAPFWADQLYADIDRAIFGRDPWLFFRGMDLGFHAWAYSFFWMIAIAGTLLWLFAQRPSDGRTASIVSYFAVWSLFGPIGQFFGSAAGPIFYQRIGLGDRFAGLAENVPYVTNAVSGYLWDMHFTRQPAVGAGISAMPSLHIATAVWIYLVFRERPSVITPFAALFSIYMLVLSVALGWHYAIDGVAGAAGALLCHWAAKIYVGRGKQNVGREWLTAG